MRATVVWNSRNRVDGKEFASTSRAVGDVLTDDPRFVSVENDAGRWLIPHHQVIEIFEETTHAE